MRLTVTPAISKDTTADLMVIPRWRSKANVSVCVVPASTSPTVSMTPAAYSSRSVSVVLPASTCARIPRFNVLTPRHVLWIGGNSLLRGHERLAHLRLLGRSAVVGSAADGHPGGQPICWWGGLPQPRASRGCQGRAGGPTYSESGRISRLSAYCSRMWAVQPAIREVANRGVYRSGGRPRAEYTLAV